MTRRGDFLKFIAIGGVSSIVNIVARILINRFTSYEWAIVLAFPIALTTAFLLNRALVFKPESRAWGHQFVRFLLVNLVALVQVFAISELFARLVFTAMNMRYHPDTLAHAIGLLSPLFTSYWAHRHFTFRHAAPPEPAAGTRS